VSRIDVTRVRSRAAAFGEMTGQVRGVDECAWDDQIRLRFEALKGRRSYAVAADRTGFFWKRRLPQGAYKIRCTVLLNGRVNAIDAGVVHSLGGINTVDLDLSGSVIVGRVQGVNAQTTWATELTLVSLDERGVTHRAMLDSHQRFVFAGLNPGRFALAGEVRGQGDVRVKEIVVRAGTCDIGALRICRRPYLRFVLTTDRGKFFRGGVDVRMNRTTRGGRTWGWEGRLREADQGAIVVRNTFRGLYCYRIDTRWYQPVEGFTRLSCDEATVPVACRRRGVAWRRRATRGRVAVPATESSLDRRSTP
jgi:hypothetical protein